MGQNDPIDDVEGREITAEYVNERVDDLAPTSRRTL